MTIDPGQVNEKIQPGDHVRHIVERWRSLGGEPEAYEHTVVHVLTYTVREPNDDFYQWLYPLLADVLPSDAVNIEAVADYVHARIADYTTEQARLTRVAFINAINNEIDHASFNDHYMREVQGMGPGESQLAVRADYLEALIEGVLRKLGVIS